MSVCFFVCVCVRERERERERDREREGGGEREDLGRDAVALELQFDQRLIALDRFLC